MISSTTSIWGRSSRVGNSMGCSAHVTSAEQPSAWAIDSRCPEPWPSSTGDRPHRTCVALVYSPPADRRACSSTISRKNRTHARMVVARRCRVLTASVCGARPSTWMVDAGRQTENPTHCSRDGVTSCGVDVPERRHDGPEGQPEGATVQETLGTLLRDAHRSEG